MNCRIHCMLEVRILYSCLKRGIIEADTSSLDLYKLEPFFFSFFGSHLPFRHSGDPPLTHMQPCLVEENPAGWKMCTSALRLLSTLILSAASLEKKKTFRSLKLTFFIGHLPDFMENKDTSVLRASLNNLWTLFLFFAETIRNIRSFLWLSMQLGF